MYHNDHGHMDGLASSFFNLMSGLGTTNDQSSYNNFCARDRIPVPVIEGCMRTDPILRNIIEAAPADTIRAWRNFDEASPEVTTEWTDIEEELDYRTAVELALAYSEIYGGAVVVPSFDSSAVSLSSMGSSFDVEDLPRGGRNLRGWLVFGASELKEHNPNFAFFRPADPRRHFPERWELINSYHDNVQGRFIRSLANKKTVIHSSWTHPVIGPRALRHSKPRIGEGYFGESRIDIMFDYISRSVMSQMSGATSMMKGTIDVFKGDFAERIDECQADPVMLQRVMDDINARLKHLMATTSANHPAALDNNESLERLGTNNIAAGTDTLIKGYVDLLVASRPIPLTRALGRQTSGMSNDDEGGLSHWYDLVDAFRNKRMLKLLRWMDQITAHDQGTDTQIWTFGELHPATEAQTADLQKKRAERDQIYHNIGIPGVQGRIMEKLAASGTYDFTEEEVNNMLTNVDDIDDLDNDLSEIEEPDAGTRD